MIYVFSYNRAAFLPRVLKPLENEKVLILDDGSDFDEGLFTQPHVRFKHRGKKGFWRTWDFALKHAKQSGDDFFMFTQDDVLNIDIKTIRAIHESRKEKPYVHHILNDGSNRRWGRPSLKKISKDTYLSGWVDCIFFCNKLALETLDFKIHPIPEARFRSRHISSGVGEQLTNRFEKLRMPIYKPVFSLAEHGEIPSVMHPDIRKKHPLKAKRKL